MIASESLFDEDYLRTLQRFELHHLPIKYKYNIIPLCNSFLLPMLFVIYFHSIINVRYIFLFVVIILLKIFYFLPALSYISSFDIVIILTLELCQCE